MANVDDIIVRLDKYLDPDRIRSAALHVLGKQKQRIFVAGLASDGNAIGQYSTKPMYLNPANSPKKFSPKGKTGKTKFADGTPHLTKYFGGGYKEFRGEIGRDNSTVNLDLGSKLRLGYQMDFQNGKYVYGFNNQFNADKAGGNEGHFGKMIFDLTQEERAEFLNALIA